MSFRIDKAQILALIEKLATKDQAVINRFKQEAVRLYLFHYYIDSTRHQSKQQEVAITQHLHSLDANITLKKLKHALKAFQTSKQYGKLNSEHKTEVAVNQPKPFFVLISKFTNEKTQKFLMQYFSNSLYKSDEDRYKFLMKNLSKLQQIEQILKLINGKDFQFRTNDIKAHLNEWETEYESELVRIPQNIFSPSDTEDSGSETLPKTSSMRIK